MNIKIFFLFLSLLDLSLNQFIYQPYEVIEYFNKEIYPKEKIEYIKNTLSNIFLNLYAFNEIAKNPPQPNFDKNYHNKVDIQKELKQIKSENRSFYEFYQDLKTAITKLRDGHVSFRFEKYVAIFSKFKYCKPLKLYIKMENGNAKMYALTNINEIYKNKFINHENVFKVINNNLNTSIKLINGKNPFDFINEFGINYFNLRNPHGTFSKKFDDFKYNINLNYHPLKIEELTNFTVIYDNGDNFTTDFIISSEIDIKTKSLSNLLLNENEKNIKNKDENLFKVENLKEKGMFEYNNNMKINNFEQSNNEALKWDYIYKDILKCKVDDNNKVNVYFIKDFENPYGDILKKCVELFDNNTYPVIVINNLNNGGLSSTAQYFLEQVFPLSTINFNKAFRKSDYLKNYDHTLASLDKCESIGYDELIKKEIKIDYGEGIFDIFSQPFIHHPKYNRIELNSLKSKLKNPRKPTDIIVFTDGFTFSAGSDFIKHVQISGGGIIVGYLGNPNKDNIPFDASMSPTSTFGHNILIKLSNEYKKFSEEYNFNMVISGIPTYRSPNNLSIPLEYTVDPVDERIQFYEYFDDSTYDGFVKNANEIFKKYKTHCNKENKKLVLVDKKCDGLFGNNYTHGGYECGDNGEWTDKCIPSYCDIGYIFDHDKNECVIDVCAIKNSNTLLIVLICVGIFIIIAVILIFVFIYIRKKKKNNSLIDSPLISDELRDINSN